MNKEWLTQGIIKTKQWQFYRYVVDWFEPHNKFNRQQIDQWLESVQSYKHDQTTTVAKVTIGKFDLVLKRYNARSFGHKIKRSLRQSRAQRCWNMSYIFAQAGLNVAPPIFMFEERFFFIRKHAFFANEYLSGDELLEVLPAMHETEQLQVVEAFKEAMTIMLKYKLSHGDMKASNLLWVNQQLFFIDLDGARQHRYAVSWLRSNKRDRKRFLKNWSGNSELEALFSWLK